MGSEAASACAVHGGGGKGVRAMNPMNSADCMFLVVVWVAAVVFLVLGIRAFIAERKAGR